MAEVRAEIDATVREVTAAVGAEVAEGDVLVRLEAAGVSIPVLAPVAGRVVETGPSSGSEVVEGDLVAVIE